ncbi:amidohydrolase family protein [Tepidibacter mesophilus]|uniref:amidohydrolase family protein n=1 Tax=Tepidibacter mesophilus TaxID=655607 RepID=UPI000C06E8C6|nr:amidohydrolase family protein [Tepidibacter mesophilus]
MKVIVEEAHKAVRKVAVHAQGEIGIRDAVMAGVDSIEHGIFLTDEIIDLMIERGTFLVPTLSALHFIKQAGIEGGVLKDVFDKTERVLESHCNSFVKAYKRGGKIACGTDAGTPCNIHGKTSYELKLMIENGMTPMDAIKTTTSEVAILLVIEKEYGSIEVGKKADILVLNENPIVNIETLFNVESVYKLGKLVK